MIESLQRRLLARRHHNLEKGTVLAPRYKYDKQVGETYYVILDWDDDSICASGHAAYFEGSVYKRTEIVGRMELFAKWCPIGKIGVTHDFYSAEGRLDEQSGTTCLWLRQPSNMQPIGAVIRLRDVANTEVCYTVIGYEHILFDNGRPSLVYKAEPLIRTLYRGGLPSPFFAKDEAHNNFIYVAPNRKIAFKTVGYYTPARRGRIGILGWDLDIKSYNELDPSEQRWFE